MDTVIRKNSCVELRDDRKGRLIRDLARLSVRAGPPSLGSEGGNGLTLFWRESLGSGEPTLLGAELAQRNRVWVLRLIG